MQGAYFETLPAWQTLCIYADIISHEKVLVLHFIFSDICTYLSKSKFVFKLELLH